MVLLVVFIACAPEPALVWWAESPDHTFAALIKRSNPGGGLSAYDYEVSVLSADHTQEHVLWQSSGCAPLYVFWTGPRTIEIAVDRSDGNCYLPGKTRSYAETGFEFTVRLSSAFKSEVCASVPFTVSPLPQ